MKKELDRERTPEYHLTVQVTDGPHVSADCHINFSINHDYHSNY